MSQDTVSQTPADIRDVHPNIANVYCLKIDRFTEALDDPEGGRLEQDAKKWEPVFRVDPALTL